MNSNLFTSEAFQRMQLEFKCIMVMLRVSVSLCTIQLQIKLKL